MAYFGIPSRKFLASRHSRCRETGLGDPDDEQFRKAAAALQSALDLNPRGGYVKGSRAREALEKAIGNVPDSLATKLLDHLLNNTGPLAELFRYRLAPETQISMYKILLMKAQRDRDRTKERLDREIRRRNQAQQEAERELRESNDRIRDMERRFCDTVNQICAVSGAASAQCAVARVKAVQNNIRCP
jgi:hypothetical protein